MTNPYSFMIKILTSPVQTSCQNFKQAQQEVPEWLIDIADKATGFYYK
jgi:hypothetical protein